MNAESLDAILRRDSDRIVNWILHSDVEWVDIAIAENEMRERVRQEAPERLALFEMIYPPRFRRIWRDWRAPFEARLP